jgi:moderate conductance mechanosensitive channel
MRLFFLQTQHAQSQPPQPATFGDSFTTAWRGATDFLQNLSPQDVLVNSGLSVLLVLVAAIASYGVSRLVRLAFRRLSGGSVDAPSRASRAAIGIVHFAIWAIAIAFVMSAWGLNLLAWAGGAGAGFVSVTARILVVLILAIAAWEGAIFTIEGLLKRAAEGAETARRAAQLRSLAPMMRGAVRTTIAVFAGMVIISQLGVEIGPLLAGAGVVGVAVGFGAQTLVKDYLTGFSLILEDIVSVGDVVRIGDSGGLVETMTLRTIRLRDFDGTLHVIPYSEAQIVHNLTKTFSYYVFDLPISYDSDIDEALRIMGAVGAAMQKEPAFTPKILEPIEVVGVDQLGDSGVVLKARVKTAPIEQWNVGREYNRRIKLAFDEAGIEIPVPHLKLLLSDRALKAVGG